LNEKGRGGDEKKRKRPAPNFLRCDSLGRRALVTQDVKCRSIKSPVAERKGEGRLKWEGEGRETPVAVPFNLHTRGGKREKPCRMNRVIILGPNFLIRRFLKGEKKTATGGGFIVCCRLLGQKGCILRIANL